MSEFSGRSKNIFGVLLVSILAEAIASSCPHPVCDPIEFSGDVNRLSS